MKAKDILDEKSLLTFDSNTAKPLPKNGNSELFFLVSTYDLFIKEKGSWHYKEGFFVRVSF